jgi:hypothetical protein
MMRLTIGLPGFLLPTTLHHVCGAVACFSIRLSRSHLIFSVSANSIRRIVTVAVSNRLNPSLPGFAEKEPLGGHYVAPLS